MKKQESPGFSRGEQVNPHYVITRTRDAVASICRTCGDTSGTTRTDAQAERWQRTHRCTTGRKP